MAFYVFKKDSDNINLDVVDAQVCEFFKERCDPTEFHPVFDFIVSVGFGILLRSSINHVTKEEFEAYVAGKPDFGEAGKLAKYLPALRKFLYEEYTFYAWR